MYLCISNLFNFSSGFSVCVDEHTLSILFVYHKHPNQIPLNTFHLDLVNCYTRGLRTTSASLKAMIFYPISFTLTYTSLLGSGTFNDYN